MIKLLLVLFNKSRGGILMTMKKAGAVIMMIIMIIALLFIRDKVMDNKVFLDSNNKISSYN